VLQTGFIPLPKGATPSDIQDGDWAEPTKPHESDTERDHPHRVPRPIGDSPSGAGISCLEPLEPRAGDNSPVERLAVPVAEIRRFWVHVVDSPVVERDPGPPGIPTLVFRPVMIVNNETLSSLTDSELSAFVHVGRGGGHPGGTHGRHGRPASPHPLWAWSLRHLRRLRDARLASPLGSPELAPRPGVAGIRNRAESLPNR
jgi:hypothetical protein